MKKLAACIIIIIIAFWKINYIAPPVLKFRIFLRNEYNIYRTHKQNVNISDLQPLTSNGDEWFSKYHFISHNGGAIQGRIKSDSLEAWNLSYSRGNRIIDADLNFTSDNYLVLRHEWSDDLEQGKTPHKMNLEEFRKTKIFMKYTPLTIEDMINFMKSHSDLFVAVDSKEDAKKIYSELVKTAKDMNAVEILERIIVSLYNTADIYEVKKIYPFHNFVLRQYGWQHNWYELAEFCVKNNIHVVNIFDFVINADPEGVKILVSKGIKIYAAVVNSLKQMQEYKNLGITGAVSDYLSESDWDVLLVENENL